MAARRASWWIGVVAGLGGSAIGGLVAVTWADSGEQVGIKTQVQALDRKIGNVDLKVGTLNTKVDGLTKDVAGLQAERLTKDDVKQLWQALGRLDGMARNLAQMRESMVRLEQEFKRHLVDSGR